MSAADEPSLSGLATRMSTEWLPALERELELSASDLPLVWDADFRPGAGASR